MVMMDLQAKSAIPSSSLTEDCIRVQARKGRSKAMHPQQVCVIPHSSYWKPLIRQVYCAMFQKTISIPKKYTKLPPPVMALHVTYTNIPAAFLVWQWPIA